MNKKKIISFFIGDVDKWKKIPGEFNKMAKDTKENGLDWSLVWSFMKGFIIIFGVMFIAYSIQVNGQYCKTINQYGMDEKLDYKQNMNLKYYNNLREDLRKDSLGVDCRINIKRYSGDLLNKIGVETRWAEI